MITRSYRHRLCVDVITDDLTGRIEACQHFRDWLRGVTHRPGVTVEDIEPEPTRRAKARRNAFKGWSRASFA